MDYVAFAKARLAEERAAFAAGADDKCPAFREVEAGFRILARHGGEHKCPDPQDDELLVREGGKWRVYVLPCGDVRDLLVRWADHPDYEPDWLPADPPRGRSGRRRG